MAEAGRVLMNVWLNPLQPTAPEGDARGAVSQPITASMGLEIIDDEITEA